ncbi:MAG: hypothetical protein CMM45_08830 [Rhodospirillaceae bacterium]|nr:hypothetical protein [Rhodospirillaceae bacterium]
MKIAAHLDWYLTQFTVCQQYFRHNWARKPDTNFKNFGMPLHKMSYPKAHMSRLHFDIII